MIIKRIGVESSFKLRSDLEMQKVLVLNFSYQPLNVTSVKRAIKMICLEKAEIIKNDGRIISTPRFKITVPSVIRLFHFIHIPHRKISLSKRYILLRDNFTCQYCGKQETKNMTIDHIIPRSRGGMFTWENLVCACKECNNRKNNRPLHEANMALLATPAEPEYISHVYINKQTAHPMWLPFLED